MQILCIWIIPSNSKALEEKQIRLHVELDPGNEQIFSLRTDGYLSGPNRGLQKIYTFSASFLLALTPEPS